MVDVDWAFETTFVVNRPPRHQTDTPNPALKKDVNDELRIDRVIHKNPRVSEGCLSS